MSFPRRFNKCNRTWCTFSSWWNPPVQMMPPIVIVTMSPGLLLDGPSFMSGFQWFLYFRVNLLWYKCLPHPVMPPEVCSLIGRLLGGPNDIFSVSVFGRLMGAKINMFRNSRNIKTPPSMRARDVIHHDAKWNIFFSRPSSSRLNLWKASPSSAYLTAASWSEVSEFVWHTGPGVGFEIWVAKLWAEQELKIEQLYHNLIFENMRWVGSFCSQVEPDRIRFVGGSKIHPFAPGVFVLIRMYIPISPPSCPSKRG